MLDLPYGGGNRIKLDKKGYAKVALAFALIIGSIVLYVFEFRRFDLILNFSRLLLGALVLGLIAGIFIGKRLSKKEEDTFEKMRIYLIVIVLALVFSPLYLSLINRWLDFSKPEYQEAYFEKAEAYISENYGVLKDEEVKIAGYKLFFIKDQEVLQIKTKSNPFQNQKKGDRVLLPVKKGLLGIHYIKFEN